MKEYSYLKKSLLKELSQDSRVSVTELAKKLKCSRNTVIGNIEALEKEFDILYTIEFNRNIVGFSIQNQVVCLKFENKPRDEELERIFKDHTYTPFLAITEGDFDMIMKIVGQDNLGFARWAYSILPALSHYRPAIYVSHISDVNTGFTSLGESSIRDLNFEKLGLDELDKKLIILLNNDSRLSYSEIAKKLHEDVETIRYRFNRILNTKLIKRCTILLKKPPTEYNVAFLIRDEIMTEGTLKRIENLLKHYSELGTNTSLPIHQIAYFAFLSGYYSFFGIGCFEDEESCVKEIIIKNREILMEDKPQIAYAKIRKMLHGYPSIRNLDVTPISLKLE